MRRTVSSVVQNGTDLVRFSVAQSSSPPASSSPTQKIASLRTNYNEAAASAGHFRECQSFWVTNSGIRKFIQQGPCSVERMCGCPPGQTFSPCFAPLSA